MTMAKHHSAASKALSVLLSVLMAFGCLGMISGVLLPKADAAITVSGNTPTLTFYVPETIYLKPSDNKTFQYFINREQAVNGGLRTSQDSTGLIYFNCASASKVTGLTCNGASVSLSAASSNNGTLKSTVNSGSLSSAIAMNGTTVITWTVTFEVNGTTRTATAYSVAYAPNRNVTANGVTGFDYNSKESFASGIIWIQGANLTSEASYSDRDSSGSTRHKYYQKLSSYALDPLVNGVENVDEKNPHDFGISSAQFTGATASFLTCHCVRNDNYDGDKEWVIHLDFNRTPAEIIADTSRYSNTSQIPNLKLGFQVTDWESSNGRRNWYVSDATSAVANPDSSNPTLNLTGKYGKNTTTVDVLTHSRWREDDFSKMLYSNGAGTVLKESGNRTSPSTDGDNPGSNVDGYNNDEGKKYWSPINYALNQGSSKRYFRFGVTGHKDDSWAMSCGGVILKITAVNKGNLRNLVNSCIGTYISPYYSFPSNYTGYLKAAATVLGNPMATASEITTAYNNLNGAKPSVKTGSATISHKSSTGKTLGTESKAYNYGQTVTAAANSYTGYSYTSANPTALTKNDVTSASTAWTLTYTPVSYSVSYNLDGGSVSPANPSSYNIETASFTLNNPTKKGYTFAGWTGSNGSSPQTSVTVATGSTGNKTYTANWTINSSKLNVVPNGGVWSGSASTQTFTQNYNTTKSIGTPTAPDGKHFTSWTLSNGANGSFSAGTYTFGPTKDATDTLTANYAEHTWNDGAVTTQPGCETEGVKTYTCTVCGATRTEPVAPAGHTESEVWSKDGTYHWKVCAVCGEITTAKAVHSGGTATCTAQKQCEICGALYGETDAGNHDYQYNSTVDPTCEGEGYDLYVCSRCGAEEHRNGTNPTGHDFTGTVHQVDGSEAHNFACANNCGTYGLVVNGTQVPGGSENCVYPETWSVKTAESCYEDGVETRNCTVCSREQTRPISAHHTLETVAAVPATCEADGNNEYFHCTVCDKYFSDDTAATETTPEEQTIPALGHEFKAENGVRNVEPGKHNYKCTRCDAYGVGAVKDDVAACSGGLADCVHKAVCAVCGTAYGEPDPANHTNLKGTAFKDATCTEKGNQAYYYCDGCGKYFSDAAGLTETTWAEIEIDAKGHDFTGDAQRLADGYHNFKCTRCDLYGCNGEVNGKQACSGGEATCKDKATCEVCGQAYGEKDPANHTNLQFTAFKDATCTEKGNQAYYYCDGCGKYFTDAAGLTGTTWAEIEIAAKGHEFKAENGVRNVAVGMHNYKCTRCNAYGVGTEENATAACGGGEPTCTEPAVCALCDTAYADPLGHDMVETPARPATCEEDGTLGYFTCKRCSNVFEDEAGQTPATVEGRFLERLGHNYDYEHATYYWLDGNTKVMAEAICLNDANHRDVETVDSHLHVTTPSTCNDNGVGRYTAAFTNPNFKAQSLSTELPLADHHFVLVAAVDPTCTADGHVAYWTCDNDGCGRLFRDEFGVNEITDPETVVLPAGEDYHAWGAWKDHGDADHTRTCAVCGDVESAEHVYPDAWTVVTEADCQKAGLEEKICTVCGKRITQDIPADPEDHTWGDWAVSATATCSAKGEEARVCAVCGKRETRSTGFDVMNHENVVTLPESDSTCTVHGLTAGEVCTACGKVLSGREEKELIDHDWGAWTVVTAATCTTPGVETRVCSMDAEGNHRQNRTIEATGHTLAPVAAKDATCTEDGNRAYYVCTICGAAFRDAEGTAATTADAEKLPAHHTYGEPEVRPASCTEKGYTVYTCTVCGYVYYDSFTPAKGHTPAAERVKVRPATETEDGYTGDLHCVDCGALLDAGEVIPHTGRDDQGDTPTIRCSIWDIILRFFRKIFGTFKNIC